MDRLLEAAEKVTGVSKGLKMGQAARQTKIHIFGLGFRVFGFRVLGFKGLGFRV